MRSSRTSKPERSVTGEGDIRDLRPAGIIKDLLYLGNKGSKVVNRIGWSFEKDKVKRLEVAQAVFERYGLISRNKNLEVGLNQGNKLTVGKSLPTHFSSGGDVVGGEFTSEFSCYVVIKKYLHPVAWSTCR